MATTQSLFSITAIKPKPADVNKVKQALFDALDKANKQIQADNAKITATWIHTVAYNTKNAYMRGNDGVASTDTDDIPYCVTDQGTGAHSIVPKPTNKTKRLHFQDTFTPKTQNRRIGSNAGGKSGAWVHPPMIPNHPGVDEREFSVAIKEDIDKLLPTLVNDAIKRTMP